MITPSATLKRGLAVLALSTAALVLSSAPALAAPPEAPSGVTVEALKATSATFHGVLNPLKEGGPGSFESGTYEFLYKQSPTECEGGSKVPASPAVSLGGGQEAVSQPVTGLTASTKYTVCLLARNGTEKNPANEIVGPSVTFTTATPPEQPKTLSPAKSITTETAKLEGTLNPHTTLKVGGYFAYSNPGGFSCTEGPTVGLEEFPGEEEKEAIAVHTTVGGLQPHQTYKFCLVATNTAGEATAGNEVALKTEPAPPMIANSFTNGVTATAATLNSEINPENEPTSDVFEYATSEAAVLAAAGTKAAGAALTGYPQQLASVALSGLQPSMTYYYRVVAENAQSKEESKPVIGAVQSFTTVPTPITEAVTVPTTTTATFNGHLTPLNEKVAAQYHFSYNLGGGACTGEQGTPTVEAGTGAGTEVKATVNVTGLQPHHEYTVCLVTSNASGSQEAAPVHFTTAAVPLEILSESMSGVTSSEAMLEAQVNPNNYKTTYTFEYATSEAALGTPGATVLPAGALEGFGAQTVSSPTGAVLSVGETYYYRILVTNTERSEVLQGQVQSFTPLGPPLVSAGVAQSITRTTATLPGTVNPAGVETFYHYQYGTTTSYGGNAPSFQGVNAGSGFSALAAPIGLSGLVPGTTYHYRLLATNTNGTTIESPDKTFTTAPSTPPTASTGEASNVTLTTATVAGTINPEGLETSYELDLGTDTTYGTSMYGEAGSARTPTQITVSLQNLAPASTYHYQIVAINSDGRVPGGDRTFTTPAYSNPIVQPFTLPLIATPAIAFPTEEPTEHPANPKKLTCRQKAGKIKNAAKRKRALKLCSKTTNRNTRRK